MDLNNLFAAVSLPGWAVAAGGFGVVLLLILLFRPRGDSGVAVLAQLAVVAIIGGTAYFGLKQYEDNSRLGERRAIEERAETLLTQVNQSDSVFGCLNATATDLDEACEKIIFAKPERIASAVSLTANRIALLYDATVYSTRDPVFLDRFDHLRKSLEADPYGLVAHVLATEHKCIPDSCTRYRILKDVEKVKANLVSGKFDGMLAKYKESWVEVRPGLNISEMPAMPPVNSIGGKLDDHELPSANTAVQMNEPSGLIANTPMIVPPVPSSHQQKTSPAPQQPAPPVANTNTNEPPAAETPSQNAKQKASPAQQKKKQQAAPVQQQKQQQSPQQAKRRGPPEPVGGLPRVTARHGQNEPADDDDDTPTAAPAPAPQPEPSSPFSIFRR
ncbi:MAG: hypothetical protein KF835_11295 [Xanthobacteraceae bacterium]|nr:hypothetical protein [Xanthobacteraceae bacterium]